MVIGRPWPFKTVALRPPVQGFLSGYDNSGLPENAAVDQ
jgi:hypothetical protein